MVILRSTPNGIERFRVVAVDDTTREVLTYAPDGAQSSLGCGTE